MRAGDHYECAACDRSGGAAALCDPRCAKARDAQGNAPPPAKSQHYEWFQGGPTQAGALLFRSVFRLAAALKRSRRRRQLRALFEAAGPPTPIAGATDGLVTIEGTVELLEAVTAASGEGVAAFIERDVRESREVRKGGALRIEHVDVRRGAGRFLVRDVTGSARIDDDWVLLLDADGDELDAREAGALYLLDGQPVRVIGHCRRGDFFDPAAGASFRGHARGLEMVGGTGRPICIVARPDAPDTGPV